MDFSEDENAEALRDLLRRFLDKEVPPQLAARWDQEDHIPREMLGRLAELGVCGLTVPEEYGGMGRDVLGMVTTIQELARRSVALAGLYIMNACYGSLNIGESGTAGTEAAAAAGTLRGQDPVRLRTLRAGCRRGPSEREDSGRTPRRHGDHQRLQALVLRCRDRGLYLHAGAFRRAGGAL